MPQLLQSGLTVEWLRACTAVLVWKHRRPRRRLVCLLCAAVLQYAVRSLSRNTDEIAADRNVLEKSMLLTTDSPILCVAAGSVCRCTEAGPTYSIVAVEAFCSFSLRIILMLTILLAHQITTNSLSPLYLLTNNEKIKMKLINTLFSLLFASFLLMSSVTMAAEPEQQQQLSIENNIKLGNVRRELRAKSVCFFISNRSCESSCRNGTQGPCYKC